MGLTVGSAVGNAATVVGNSVVEAAETSVNALPSEIKDAANSLGDAVVATGNFVADVGEVVADAAVDLAGDVLQVAEFAVNQGVKVGSALGNKIVSAANAIGDGVQKVGALAVGLAKATWEVIKSFIACLLESFSLCKLMLDEVCDCDAGSSISMGTSGMGLRCVFKAGGLSSGFGFTAGGSFEMGDKSSSGRIKLPGQSFVQSFKPQGSELKARQAGAHFHCFTQGVVFSLYKMTQVVILVNRFFHPESLGFLSIFLLHLWCNFSALKMAGRVEDDEVESAIGLLREQFGYGFRGSLGRACGWWMLMADGFLKILNNKTCGW